MMTFDKKNVAVEADLDARATECFLALADDDLPRAQRKAWMDWLLEKPEHHEAYDRVDNLWRQLNGVGPVALPSADELAADDYSGDTALPLPMLPQRIFAKVTHLRAMRARTTGIVAIAASLMIAVGLSFYVGFWDGLSHQRQVFATRPAQIAAFDLPDGSKITLAGDSAVDSDFSPQYRDLVLVRGQAFFDVAKDAKRPFIVHSGSGSVTAIGTKFDVNNVQGLITVTVAHGLVRVASGDVHHPASMAPDQSAPGAPEGVASTLVGMGEQVSYSASGDLHAVQAVNLEQALSWRQGYLTLVNEPLTRAIEQINRYATHRIYYRRADIQDLHVSGTVYLDRIDYWLKGLEQGYAVKVVEAGQEGVLLTRKNQ